MRGLTIHCAGLLLAGVLAAAPGGMAASAATQDSFQPVGNLVHDRDGAQVTLLKDGTVLVTGGTHWVGSTNSATTLASVELFDPKTNKFTAVGDMSSPRNSSHRAVLLNDGRVLITGGGSRTGTTQLHTAELYDPATRAFTAVGDMKEPRAAQTTTLLPDGQVLVAGGYDVINVHGPTASAELFNPATGMFQPTGSLVTGRYWHAAVSLPDGRVALLGGYDPDNEALRSVEIYDPNTGKFAAGGNLAIARGDLTASLLPDGRVLVVGGTLTDPTGNVVGARKEVEIYDPATGQSTITDDLTDARVYNVLAPLADGQFLVAGGTLINGTDWIPLGTAAIVDPTTGKLSPAPSMTAARSVTSGVALPDGRVLIVGGDGGTDGSSLNTAEVFVPGTAPTSPSP